MSFQRREPRENPTSGFRFEKPTRAQKAPKWFQRRANLRSDQPGQVVPGDPAAAKKSRVKGALAAAGNTLKRSRPMRRAWMKRNRIPRRVFRETPEEKLHKKMIREMRVCAVAKYAYAGRCRGPLQSAHLGPGGGMSRTHGDWTTATRMCRAHHMQHDGHERPSVFDGMSPDDLLAFREHEIHLAREFVAGRRTVSA